MEKKINGKMYVLVPIDGIGCDECAFVNDGIGCLKASLRCFEGFGEVGEVGEEWSASVWKLKKEDKPDIAEEDKPDITQEDKS